MVSSRQRTQAEGSVAPQPHKFHCTKCHKEYTNKINLNHHFQVIHCDNMILCGYPGCDNVFRSLNILYRHRKSHPDREKHIPLKYTNDGRLRQQLSIEITLPRDAHGNIRL